MNKKRFSLGNRENSILGLDVETNIYDFNYNKETYNINNKMDSHAIICNYIKDNSEILDVGCATGKIGTIINDFKIGCHIDGIEYDKETFKELKKNKFYRNVYNFSILDTSSTEYKKFIENKMKYDYIVLADILEHLYNPWDVLINLKPLLKKNGKIIISLPNVSHLDIIRGLLDNEFNYKESGLLDNTHIRFFTINSFIDMIDNIATNNNIYYNVKLIGKVNVPLYEETENVEIVKYLKSLNKDIDTLQNIIELTLVSKDEYKKMSKKKLNNMNIINDDYLEYKRLQEENKNIKEENKNLKQEYERVSNEYRSIVESKRWKLINNLLNKFHR